MSLILRNHCLQGSLRAEYQNLVDFSLLISKLDKEYLDKERVVDLVTRQLAEFRPVKAEDYSGFIGLVTMIEMAHLDLSAVKNSTTLCNPMTVRLIEQKCPDWVVKSLMAAKGGRRLRKGKNSTFCCLSC